MSLADQTCVPCKGGHPPMAKERAEELLREVDEGWALNADGHLERTYTFSNFVDALAFANRVGEIAEEQNHHPDLHVAWGKCTVWPPSLLRCRSRPAVRPYRRLAAPVEKVDSDKTCGVFGETGPY